ncbi:MAG: flagellar hook-length control protein FliK [Paenibacillus sp.]|nr:flagellar hook-length control protein FliK [Paenibacillus sp.]
MNSPFLMLNSMQSSGGSPIGLIVPQSGLSQGTNGATGNGQFTNVLLQAMLGQESSASAGSSGVSLANLLASIAFTDKDGSGAGSDELLASLLTQLTKTNQPLSVELSRLLTSNALTSSASNDMQLAVNNGLTQEGPAQTGELLADWLDRLQSEHNPEDQMDQLNDLFALLDLAQVVVMQWQTPEQTADAPAQNDALTAIHNDTEQSKPVVLMHTLQQLVELLKQHPNEPEIKHLVQSFEQLIQQMQQNSANAAQQAASNPAAQAQAPMHAVGNEAVSVPAAVLTQSTKPNWKTSGKEEANRAPVVTLWERAADRKDRLQALAAKAGVQPQLTAVQSPSDIVGSNEASSTETLAAGNTDEANNSQMPLHQLGRHTMQSEQPNVQTHVVHADRFAEQMAQAMKSLKAQHAGGLSEVRILLQPEHLGQVDIKVTMQDGHVVARFIADSVHGKEMLESQLSQLKAMLSNQGLQVERLEVLQYTPQQSGAFQDSRRQPQQSNRGGKEQSNEADKTDAIDFLSELEQASAARTMRHDGIMNTIV